MAPLDQEELDALYRQPVSDFVAARNRWAKKLRSEGDGETSDWVRRLKKPVATAALVNRLYWEHPQEFRQLFDAGAEIRSLLLQQADAPAQRAAAERRQRAIQALLVAAARMMKADSVSPSVAQRLSRTLEALSVYGSGRDGEAGPPGEEADSRDSARQVAGRLSRDLEPPGFEAMLELGVDLASASASGAATKRTRKAGGTKAAGSSAARARANATLSDLAKSSSKAAEAKHRQERERARDLISTLEQRLAKARTQAKEAEVARRTTVRAAESASRALQRIEKKLEQQRQLVASRNRERGRAEREHRKAELTALTLEKQLESERAELERLTAS